MLTFTNFCINCDVILANVLALKPKLAGIERNLANGKITNDLYNQLLEQQAEKLIQF